MKLITSTDLQSWAETRESQDKLPLLIRRLIINNIGFENIRFINMPGGDSIWKPGPDGEIITRVNSILGNAGRFIIECGQKADYEEKFKEDLMKRIDELRNNEGDSVFVFITSRKVKDKTDTLRKIKESITGSNLLKNILLFDADDIETWLDFDFATTAWLADILEKPSYGIKSFDLIWKEWTASTEIPIDENIILAREKDKIREDNEKKVNVWLGDIYEDGKGCILKINSASKKESLLFFMASILKSDFSENKIDALKSQFVVVKNRDKWELLTEHKSSKNLIIVPYFGITDNFAHLIDGGFKIFIPYGAGDSVDKKDDKIVYLTNLSNSIVFQVLKSKMGSHEKANAVLQKLDKGTLIHLQRILRRKDIPLPKPEWADKNNWEILVPVALIDSWDENNKQDKEVIEHIIGKSYEEIVKKLLLLVRIEEAPVKKEGNIYKVMDPEFILEYLGGYMTQDILERTMESAGKILSVIDKEYNLPREKRTFFDLDIIDDSYNYFSREIKKGISQGLAILGSRDTFFDASLNVKSYVGNKIGELLKGKDWKTFASLNSVFHLLAEAAPEVILETLESITEKQSQIIKLLYENSMSASFFGAECLYSGILFGLEKLAWSAQYFSRVANILIEFAQLYPEKTRWHNSPAESFKKVFCPWSPQTSVSLDNKKESIDALIKAKRNNKDTLFSLLHSLLPVVPYQILFPSSHPEFLETIEPVMVTDDEVCEFYNFIFLKELSMLGTDEAKWKLMIEYVNSMDDTQFSLFIDHFNKIDFSKAKEIFKIKIYQNLKNCLHRYNNPIHRDEFKSKVERIQEMLSKISLDNSIDKYVYLFSKENVWDFAKTGKEPSSVLKDAVKDIVKNKGVDGIVEFAKKVDNPDVVGLTLAYSEFGNDEVKGILNAGEKLENPAQSMAVFFIAATVAIKGVDILDEVYNPEWSDSYKRLILYKVKSSKSFWEWIDKKELSSLYWKNIESVYTSDNEEYKIALRKLDEYKNYSVMLELVFWNMRNADSNDIAKALLENTNILRLYYFEQLMSVLYNRGDIDDRIMFRIEMKYFELFDPASKLSPRTVIKYLQINPKFFVEIISLYFCGERLNMEERCKKKESESIEEQNKSNMALKLLLFFEKTFLFADIGEQEAKAWLNSVVPLLEKSKSDCKNEGYVIIGSMLVNALADPKDGIWPVKYVREFIEESNSESLKNLERGLVTRKFNSVFVHSIDPEDPGRLYSSRAAKFRSDAEKIRFKYPKTARVLDKIAENYEYKARMMNNFKI
jgi:hypothetical protein